MFQNIVYSPFLLAQSMLREEGEKYLRKERCSVTSDGQFEALVAANYEIQDFVREIRNYESEQN